MFHKNISIHSLVKKYHLIVQGLKNDDAYTLLCTADTWFTFNKIF